MVNIISLKRYGMLLKKYLKELNPMKYSRLTIYGDLMDFLYDEEKYFLWVCRHDAALFKASTPKA